jgi:NADPH-dependent glutamate synthase beta subunit-like oxidoreductase
MVVTYWETGDYCFYCVRCHLPCSVVLDVHEDPPAILILTRQQVHHVVNAIAAISAMYMMCCSGRHGQPSDGAACVSGCVQVFTNIGCMELFYTQVSKHSS